MTSQPPSYRRYRFPPDIISHAVWLYHRFGLSFRDVEICSPNAASYRICFVSAAICSELLATGCSELARSASGMR